MLIYKNLSGIKFPLTEYTEYYIDHTDDGEERLVIKIPINTDVYKEIAEEGSIDSGNNTYLVKKINDGTVECELDFDFLKSNFYAELSGTNKTFKQAIESILPSMWTIVGDNPTKKSSYTLKNITGKDAVDYFLSEYGVYVKWNIKAQILFVYDKTNITDSGVYVTDELNLRNVAFRGDTTEFITRLYCYGKGGVGISSVNSGKEYIEDYTYSNKVVCGVYETPYELPENILAAGRMELERLSKPARAYECDVVDLAKIDSSYDFLSISLYSIVTLIDNRTGISVKHRVVRYREYPDEPSRNVITLSSNFSNVCDIVEVIAKKADTADKSAASAYEEISKIQTSLTDYAKKSEVSASIDTYVNSETGRASIVASLSGKYVTMEDASGYVSKTELSAEIGAYIDTQAGTAKIVNKLDGTFAKTDALGNYVQKTQLSTEIGSYIDTATGKAKIISAASGTYQKKSDMSGYVTTTELNTSVAQYIDSSTGKAKIVSACSGTYAKSSDLNGYAKVSAVTSIEQSVSDVEAAITLSSSYSKNTIGTNVNALLQLVSNPNSSNIKIKADKIDIDGTLYLKSSDFLASGTTMIKGAKIQTSDLYIQQLRTTSGDYLIDYYGNILSIGGGVSGYNRNFASFDMIDMIIKSSVRIGYASSVYLGFYYESYGFTLRPASTTSTFKIGSASHPIDEIRCSKLYVDGKQVVGSTGSSTSSNKFDELQVGTTSYYWKIDESAIVPNSTSSSYFNVGSSTYPIQKLYAKTIYLNGDDISTLISKTPKFTSMQVGGSTYYWKIDEDAILPNSTSSLYFNIGSSTYPVQKLYAKEIYLNGTKLTTTGGSSSGTTSADYSGKELKMGGSSSYHIVANTSRELRPTNSSIYSNYFYLGTSGYFWHYAYIGSVSATIGSNSGSKLGFFGATPAARQSVSNSATVATLINALKQYGLIA